MREDLVKFGMTMAWCCIEDKFTLSGLHASLISVTTISFLLLDKQEPKWKELTRYSMHFGFKLEDLEDNWTQLHKFWPYPEAKTSAPSMRLKAGHPGNWFFKFVSAALRTYLAQALASNQQGSDGHLLLRMFLAAYYVEGVTAGYFNVHGLQSPLWKSAQIKGCKTPANTGDELSSPRKCVLSLLPPANPKKSKTVKTSAQGSCNLLCHASTLAPRHGGTCPNTRSQHDDELVSDKWEV
jgi:hypothetical protein